MSYTVCTQQILDAFSSRVLSDPGNGGQQLAHLNSTLHTDIRPGEFGRGLTNLLEGSRRRPGCVSTDIMSALLIVQAHRVRENVPAD